MSKVQLTTVTPVHIGNGNVLHNNIDFVFDKVNGYDYIGVVSPEKVMGLIPQGMMDKWVATIERGEDIKEFVTRLSKDNVTLEDYSLRLIYCPQKLELAQGEPMRELIHNGFGRAYIPGSSLKGAIRTALFAYFVKERELDIDRKIDFSGKTNPKFMANKLSGELFGRDPNTDCLRFLQVGDAYFEDGCEDVLNMININQRKTRSFLDKSKHQLVEVVTSEEKSRIFNMKIVVSEVLEKLIKDYNSFVIEWNKDESRRRKNIIERLKITNLNELFSLLNNHTASLIEEEKDIWLEDVDNDGVTEYIEALDGVLKKVEECKKGECVIRVGHASGWRWTTGAWTEKILNDENWEKLVNVSRPHNQRYDGFMFPKSRRVNSEGKEFNLLGFVKLKIVEE